MNVRHLPLLLILPLAAATATFPPSSQVPPVPLSGVSPASAQARLPAPAPTPKLTGEVTARWGAHDVNRCVPDVSAALGALVSPGDLMGFRLAPLRGLNRLFAHWQGIQRVPGGDGRWLVLSRSGAGIGFVLVHLESRDTLRSRWGSNRDDPDRDSRDTPPPASDRAVAELPPPAGHSHGGGMQMIGQILVVPFEKRGAGSVVAFYDLSRPERPRLLHAFDRSNLAPPSNPNAASATAIARLADGRYLLIVGVRSSKVLDFYLSEGTTLEADQVRFRWFRTLSGAVAGGFQNMNLVTQCDGTLFLVGTLNTAVPPPSLGSDLVQWYRLTNGPDGGPLFTAAGTRQFECRKCNFGAGAGLYLDPAGALLLYSVEHGDRGPESSVQFEEFFPVARGGVTRVADAWAEFYDDRHFDDLTFRLEGRTSTPAAAVMLPPRQRDRVTSVRWTLPPGWRLRLFADPDCAGAHRDLTGTGETDDLSTLGFDDRLACARWLPDTALGGPSPTNRPDRKD